jgi:hypothetical protein
VRRGVLNLPRFQFHVRGSTLDLGGSYQLQAGTLDFVGTLTLDAPLSRTTAASDRSCYGPSTRSSGRGQLAPQSRFGFEAPSHNPRSGWT